MTDRQEGRQTDTPPQAALPMLERRLQDLLDRVYASDAWKAVTAPESPPHLAVAVLREVMWAVSKYQRHTTEAGFTMLGRLPKSEVKLLMSLTHHKAEEAAHGEWAARDYRLLGGTQDGAAAPNSPAVFAVIGVWDRLASSEDPFAYLGAEFLFEALTMAVAPQALDALRAKGLDLSKAGFVVEHATEDVKHTRLIEYWITDIGTRYPGARDAMARGFDYFAQVYPLPVWGEALERACAVADQGA